MNRRSFLSSMFAVSAAGLLVPTTTYFFAPWGGWKIGVGPELKRLVKLNSEFTHFTIGQYADYASHVWDSQGRHYNLVKADDLVSAENSSDEFVRSLALFKAAKLPPSGYMSRLSK